MLDPGDLPAPYINVGLESNRAGRKGKSKDRGFGHSTARTSEGAGNGKGSKLGPADVAAKLGKNVGVPQVEKIGAVMQERGRTRRWTY